MSGKSGWGAGGNSLLDKLRAEKKPVPVPAKEPVPAAKDATPAVITAAAATPAAADPKVSTVPAATATTSATAVVKEAATAATTTSSAQPVAAAPAAASPDTTVAESKASTTEASPRSSATLPAAASATGGGGSPSASSAATVVATQPSSLGSVRPPPPATRAPPAYDDREANHHHEAAVLAVCEDPPSPAGPLLLWANAELQALVREGEFTFVGKPPASIAPTATPALAVRPALPHTPKVPSVHHQAQAAPATAIPPPLAPGINGGGGGLVGGKGGLPGAGGPSRPNTFNAHAQSYTPGVGGGNNLGMAGLPSGMQGPSFSYAGMALPGGAQPRGPPGMMYPPTTWPGSYGSAPGSITSMGGAQARHDGGGFASMGYPPPAQPHPYDALAGGYQPGRGGFMPNGPGRTPTPGTGMPMPMPNPSAPRGGLPPAMPNWQGPQYGRGGMPPMGGPGGMYAQPPFNMSHAFMQQPYRGYPQGSHLHGGGSGVPHAGGGGFSHHAPSAAVSVGARAPVPPSAAQPHQQDWATMDSSKP